MNEIVGPRPGTFTACPSQDEVVVLLALDQALDNHWSTLAGPVCVACAMRFKLAGR
jgi:hypothetical protein